MQDPAASIGLAHPPSIVMKAGDQIDGCHIRTSMDATPLALAAVAGWPRTPRSLSPLGQAKPKPPTPHSALGKMLAGWCARR